MSVHRLLSKRHAPGEKQHHFLGRHTADVKSSPTVPPRPRDASSHVDFFGLFDAKDKPANQHEEQKVQSLRKRVLSTKSVMIKDAQILWTLRSNFSGGNEDKAYTLLLAISNASEGLVEDYKPGVKLLGSENRQGVTCFLDATLFSMFSRLESFEAMLYNSFDDERRNKLGLLLRLWVNLLRTGNLITTDLTKLIQESLADCGWSEAAKLHQQDASEAFSFITGKLELPLLTLKMDIYHTGKEDANDDHKFINERLLEVAIPQDLAKDKQSISLEECLEEYFNNRVEVRRYLERRSTLQSLQSFDSSKKASGIHIETVELDSDSSATPLSSSPSYSFPPRPSTRHRTPSIIQERYIPEQTESGYSSLSTSDFKTPASRIRSGSIRKEVMMPAWQFFSLIPWYTDHAPSNDAQVATHFSSRRPVLGLCLKRYSMTPQGKAIRLNTSIDIPIEIGLPHFIQDDHMEDDGPIYGSFKLSLQAVVCHRGYSVDSGHYVALARSTTRRVAGSAAPAGDPTHWVRFDDLATERVTLVDIEKALKEETPYLLFYQIVPIEGDPGHILDGEQPAGHSIPEESGSVTGGSTASLALRTSREGQPLIDRPSVEVTEAEDSRGQKGADERRPSIAFSEPLPDGIENTVTGRLVSLPSSRAVSPVRRKSADMSRRSSGVFDVSLSRTLSKLKANKSKEMIPTENIIAPDPRIRQASNSITASHESPAIGNPSKPASASHKSHKQEKSKSRLTRRTREDKPDRECVVM